MDDPRTDRGEIARAFRFIRWINRRLRGTAGLIRRLDERAAELGGAWSLLDVGTGCADIPLAALEWSRRRAVGFSAVGIDLLDASLDDARRELARARDRWARLGRAAEEFDRAVTVRHGDAFALAELFPPRSFDVVHAGMFLHHFTDEEIVRLLSLMGRTARRMVVWNDLSRDAWSRAAVRGLTLALPRIVRHDAVLSVDKGFRADEIRDLVARAGLPAPQVMCWRWAGRFSAAIPIA